jgi:hypothetical protein
MKIFEIRDLLISTDRNMTQIIKIGKNLLPKNTTDIELKNAVTIRIGVIFS